jgi:hypothetical protein
MLKRIWEAWKRIAHKVGNFQARLLLTILYIVLVLPFGVGVRLFADPLRIRKKPQGWLDHESDAQDMDWARRQW